MRASPLLVAGAIALGLELLEEDVAPVATPAALRAEGFEAIEGDFHLHTRFSDGIASPFDLVLLAERKGLGTIAVTEHNTTFPAKLARSFARARGSKVIVVVGEEVTSREAHLLALGIEETVDPRGSIEEVATQVHAQGGVLIAAHPVERFWPGLEGSCEVIDGVERLHPLAFRPPSGFGSFAEVQAFEARCAASKPLAVIGNSDFHVGPDFGAPRTLLFVRERTEAGVVEAIRERRTVVRDPDGSLHGEARWVAAAQEIAPAAPAPTGSPLRTVASVLALALTALGLLSSDERDPPRGKRPAT